MTSRLIAAVLILAACLFAGCDGPARGRQVGGIINDSLRDKTDAKEEADPPCCRR